MVERCRQLEGAVARHPAPGRLEPGHTAGGGRKSDRPAGIRADRSEAHPRRGRHARSARRRTRPVVRVPGIDRHGDRGMMIGECALGELQLAQADRSGRVQPLDHRAVEVRPELAMDRHARRGCDALRVAQVLEADRHTVQRALVAARHDLLLGPARLLERELRGHGREGMQPRLQALDPAQHRLGQLDRRDLAGLDQVSDFGQLEVVEIVHAHSHFALRKR